MRKVLSFVLASSLVLGSFGSAFAATPANGLTDLTGKNCENQARALYDLNVISGYGDGLFAPEKTVTRAEMAAMIVKALGLSESGASNTFKDAKGHWAKEHIGMAQSLEIITGYPDGTFKPDAKVNYNEAVTMIVKALGYNQESLPGIWPNNYLAKAQRLGLSTGIATGSAGAVRGDIAIMLYRALEEEIGTTNKDGLWKSDSTTMLDGLDAVADTSFSVITGNEDSSISLYDYLGQSAKSYKKDGKIVAIKEIESKTLVGEFKSATEFKVGDNTYYYTDGNDTYVPFVNGKAGTATNAALAGAGKLTIMAKVSGNKISKIVATDKWNQEASFKYATDMLDGKTFNTYTLPTQLDGKTVDTSKFQLIGAANLQAIAKDSIVTVYVSDSKIVKIAVSAKTATGKVTQISSDNKYTIGGTQYELATNPAPATPGIGEEGTVRLDAAGKIAEWKVTAGAKHYGMLLAVQAKTGSLDTDKVKVFTNEGKEEVYTVSDATAFSNASTAGVDSLIEFEFDKDGKIKAVTERSLATFAGKVSASNNLIGNLPVDANVLVFVMKSAGKYEIAKVSDLQKDNALNTSAAYGSYTPSGDAKAKVMVVAKADTTKTNSVYVLLHEVNTALDADGDTVNALVGLKDGKEYKAVTDNTGYFSGFSGHAGLYQLSVDANGVVTAKDVSITSVSAITGVTVDAIDGNLVKLNTNAWVSIDANAVIYVYNATKEEYEVKTISALKGKSVTMYQIDKDSEQYDIVVVQ